MASTVSLIVAAVIGLGLLGLGRSVGVRSAGAAWIVGWTVVWWTIAVSATVSGPWTAVIVGSLTIGVGVLLLGFHRRPTCRELAVGLGGLVVGAPAVLVPPFFFDALVYHLGLPWSWLVNESFLPMAHHLFSYFPLAGSALFLIPVALDAPEAAAALHWLTFVLVAVTSMSLARRLGAGRWAWIAAVCTVASWHAPWVAGLPAVDHLVLLALVVLAVESVGVVEGEGGGPWLAGAAVGLAAATKYTAVGPVAAVLVGVVCVSPRRWRWSVQAGVIGVLLSSFWWLRNLVLTGNPVFPLAWNLLGGAGWSAEDQDRWLGVLRTGAGEPGSVVPGFLRLIDIGGMGPWLLVASVLAVPAVLGRGAHVRAARAIAVAFAVCAVFWVLTAQVPRYGLVMSPLVGAIAAAGAGRLGRFGRCVAVGALVITVSWGVATYLSFAFGDVELWQGLGPSAERWRHRMTVNDPLPAYRAAAVLLPPEATVLVVGDGRPWRCPRAHHVSSPLDRQLLQTIVEGASSPDAVANELCRAGFTDLLINWAEIDRLGGAPYRVLGWSTSEDAGRWRRFLVSRTRRLWAQNGLEIRRLLHRPAGREGVQ